MKEEIVYAAKLLFLQFFLLKKSSIFINTLRTKDLQALYDFGGLYLKSRQFAVAVGTATADTNHLTHPFHIEPIYKRKYQE